MTSARDIAVELVDGARGYTLEFAPNPAAHRQEYDHFTERIAVYGERQREAAFREAKEDCRRSHTVEVQRLNAVIQRAEAAEAELERLRTARSAHNFACDQITHKRAENMQREIEEEWLPRTERAERDVSALRAERDRYRVLLERCIPAAWMPPEDREAIRRMLREEEPRG